MINHITMRASCGERTTIDLFTTEWYRSYRHRPSDFRVLKKSDAWSLDNLFAYIWTFLYIYLFFICGKCSVTREETTTSVSTLCFNGRKQEEKENLSLRWVYEETNTYSLLTHSPVYYVRIWILKCKLRFLNLWRFIAVILWCRVRLNNYTYF